MRFGRTGLAGGGGSRKLTLSVAGAVVGAIVAVTAAAAATSVAAASPGEICPRATKANGIVQCTVLYSGNVKLRLPHDPSKTRLWGGFTRDMGGFWTRKGTFPLSASVKASMAENTEYGNLVYVASVAHGEVVRLTPRVHITDDAVLQAFFAGRVMEGTIDAKEGRKFRPAKISVRVEFAKNVTDGLIGRIVNANRYVLSSDGSCFQRLSVNQHNPLGGKYTSKVTIRRFTAMHAPGNDELVLDWGGPSNMGPEFYPSIATVLGGDPLGRVWSTEIHGVPGSGPGVRLSLVRGGGADCPAAKTT